MIYQEKNIFLINIVNYIYKYGRILQNIYLSLVLIVRANKLNDVRLTRGHIFANKELFFIPIFFNFANEKIQ